ncbi:uncharacterized protein LOC144749667 isoform X2 [Ciona intestinalis]
MEKGKETFHLKLDVIKEVFYDVWNQPVAIISVSGARRKGKSFILNLLLLYLSKSESTSRNVRRGKTLNTFHSKNGTESQTIGIHITSKPIMLRDQHGKEVAVFLMDTEGLFDKERNAKDSSTIFAMSTLLSSLQIYNVSDQLQESDLQHMQIFCNYTMLAVGPTSKLPTTSAPFQTLMFLLRNWSQMDYECGSKGGEQYLEYYLKTDVRENQLVRQQIKNSFSAVGCFLLPHPGKKVASGSENQILISDIDEDFLEQVDNLGERLFGKQNITAKRLNDTVTTGRGFVDLAIRYAEILHTGKMPPAESIVKANQAFLALNQVKQLEQEYQNEMKNKVGEKYMKPAKLKDLHKNCLEKALQQYDEFPLCAVFNEMDKDRLKINREYMKANLEEQFLGIQLQNEAIKIYQEIAIKEGCEAAVAIYKGELYQAAKGQFLEDIGRPAEIAKKKAMKCFNVCTKTYERDFVKESESTLQSAIDSEYKDFEEKNNQLLINLVDILDHFASRAECKYIEKMNEIVEKPGNDVDFFQLQSKALEESLKVFEENKVGKGLMHRQIKRNMLQKNLQKIQQKCWERFVMFRNTEVLNCVKKADQKYQQYFAQFKSDAYMEEEKLISLHKRATSAAMEVFADLLLERGVSFVQECTDRFKEKMTNQLELLLKHNTVLEQKATSEFRKTRTTCFQIFLNEMSKINQKKYVEDTKVQEKINRARERAISQYSAGMAPPYRGYFDNKNELSTEIDESARKLIACNNKLKEKVLADLELFHCKLKTDYVRMMNEITTDRYANKKSLEKLHVEFKRKVIQEIKKAIPYKDFQDGAIKRCSDLNSEIIHEAASTKWQSFKGNVSSGATTGATVGTGLMGVVGAGFVGLAGGVAGGVAGLAKAAIKFRYNMSIVDLPSIKYLRSLKL